MLNGKQIKFLQALMDSTTVAEAMEKAGVKRSTGYFWLREDNEFRSELDKQKTQAMEIIGIQMQNCFGEAIQKLMEIIRDECVSAQVKVNAIDCLLRHGKSIIEDADILRRLEAIEAKQGDENDE